MSENSNLINYRTYFVSFALFLFALFIIIKLFNIQWVHGEYYRKLGKKNVIKSFKVKANRGNIYSSDGNLLAVSVPIYNVYFDALSPTETIFKDNIRALSDSLSDLFGKSEDYYNDKLITARNSKKRFFQLGKDLTYTQYARLKTFPILNLGTFKGGRIDSIREVRIHPLKGIAERTIGYISIDKNGKENAVGIEGAFSKYLNGRDGNILKQKIAKGQYKPLYGENEIEPIDGFDIISTIDINIQDIAHHALLESLKKNEAEHGCVVVMETKTGHIKAISNLGRTKKNSEYRELLNYAIREKGEPGSTFKLVDLIALLEDKKVDTNKVYDRKGGLIKFFGKDIVDSHREGPQKISLARGFEISSNTVLVQAVYKNYKNNPNQFVNRIKRMRLHKPLGVSLKGEGKPFIPMPNSPKWNGLTLPWMAFGYGLEITPLQTLTLYNAIANDGEMVKPQFVSEIKQKNRSIKKFEKEVVNSKICSESTVKKLKILLENVVKRGTAKSLYTKSFSIAGKTGTAQGNYGKNDGSNKHYISSFVGFFPADKPKFSCVVVIHKPSTKNNTYYGADVAGPVFKRIAQKIITDLPISDNIEELDKKLKIQEKDYSRYWRKITLSNQSIPNLKGMPGMDAIALLENIGLKVKLKGNLLGKVKSQSIEPNGAVRRGKTIELILQ